MFFSANNTVGGGERSHRIGFSKSSRDSLGHLLGYRPRVKIGGGINSGELCDRRNDMYGEMDSWRSGKNLELLSYRATDSVPHIEVSPLATLNLPTT